MNERTRTKALNALEGMHTIARADMMEPGMYISPDVEAPQREKAVCRGHKACAIGSLWLGYGVKIDKVFGSGDLPGTEQGSERSDFVKTRPGLRVALEALNGASKEYMEKNSLSGTRDYIDPVESLFESDELEGAELRSAMLKVIAAAKRKVKAAA